MQFIAINSQLYKDSSGATKEGADQDKWFRALTAQLKESRERNEMQNVGDPKNEAKTMRALSVQTLFFGEPVICRHP